jgi:hypothetical protein
MPCASSRPWRTGEELGIGAVTGEDGVRNPVFSLSMAAKIPKEGGSSRAKTKPALDELSKKLVLVDEELDDVVIPRDDFMNLREEARWMAVVRVHTDRHFSNQPFFPEDGRCMGFCKEVVDQASRR